MSERVAIVTGASEGIGYSIVKGLCAKFNGIVYLTASDTCKGLAAVEKLRNLGFHPEFQKLDVVDESSVTRFREFIKKKHGGIDLLVNNAAICDTEDAYPSYEDAKRVIDANFRSMITIEAIVYPLLRDYARVVNISDCGHPSNIRNKEYAKVLSSKTLTLSQLEEFVDNYLESVKNGTLKKDDYADDAKHAAYRVSMIALTALTNIHQRKYASKNISMNSVHPGPVFNSTKDNDEAAAAPLYLALEASHKLKGTYMWFDKKLVDLYDVDGDYFCKRVGK